MSAGSDAAALLELDRVVKTYGGDGNVETPVLKGVDLIVREGESVAITGPSGSGKSTLLNLMGTLDSPTSGHVRIAGRDVAALAERDLAELRGGEVGFIFQLHHLLPQCTALENVLVPTLVGKGRDRSDAEARATALLERVGLKDRLHYRPGQLSGGERQRVAVVRALVNRPRLLLADEPTGSLDRGNAVRLAELLAKLNEEDHVAVVMVTHAADLAGRMRRQYRLADGQLHPVGS
jgi:lipoprotein-releasing system ATP-binding protein